jgi:hypothetical protein
MQFFKSAVVLALAFVTLASAAVLEKKAECKPLLQSCKGDWDCCADLCILGVCVFIDCP